MKDYFWGFGVSLVAYGLLYLIFQPHARAVTWNPEVFPRIAGHVYQDDILFFQVDAAPCAIGEDWRLVVVQGEPEGWQDSQNIPRRTIFLGLGGAGSAGSELPCGWSDPDRLKHDSVGDVSDDVFYLKGAGVFIRFDLAAWDAVPENSPHLGNHPWVVGNLRSLGRLAN